MEGFFDFVTKCVLAVGLCCSYNSFSIFRRLRKMAYTPLFFLVYPLESLNVEFKEYFGDWYNEEKKINISIMRNMLMKRGASSFIVDAFVWPTVFGLLLGVMVVRSEFIVFVIMFLLWRGWEIRKSMRRLLMHRFQLRSYSLAFEIRRIIAIYVCYLIIAVSSLCGAFWLSRKYLNSERYGDFGEILVQWYYIFVFSALISAVIIGAGSGLLVREDHEDAGTNVIP